MSRARSPNRDKAFEIYKQHNGEILLKDIATQLDVSESTVRSWKNRYKWDDEISTTSQKNKCNVANKKVIKENKETHTKK